MKKVLVLLLLISLGLNLGLGLTLLRNQPAERPSPGSWGAHDGPHPEGGPPPEGGPGQGNPFGKNFLERKLRFLEDRLDLDGAQLAALRQVHEDASTGVRSQAERVRAARLQLREAAGAPLEEDLRGLIAHVGQEQARLDSLVTEVMFQELDILDREQRRKYLDLMPANRFEGRYGRRGRGHGRAPHGQ